MVNYHIPKRKKGSWDKPYKGHKLFALLRKWLWKNLEKTTLDTFFFSIANMKKYGKDYQMVIDYDKVANLKKVVTWTLLS